MEGVPAASAAGETPDMLAMFSRPLAYPLAAPAYCSAICLYSWSFIAELELKKISSKGAVWECSWAFRAMRFFRSSSESCCSNFFRIFFAAALFCLWSASSLWSLAILICPLWMTPLILRIVAAASTGSETFLRTSPISFCLDAIRLLTEGTVLAAASLIMLVLWE